MTALRLGIVGACGRGRAYRAGGDALPGARVQAVCDTNEAQLRDAAAYLGAAETYLDYQTMLDRAEIDAVVLATPMPLHVPQAIAALRRGRHVLSEVPAGVSVEECAELVLACRASPALYMMAENYIYRKPALLVRALVRAGLLGAPYYAEAAYVHELKAHNERTPWRRRWQTGVNGNTYPTHSLGPVLQWMPGDRVVAVACAGSGHHYRDPRGDLYEQEDSIVTLCRLASGGLVQLRLDMLSNRPHALETYQLQGTEGCYESGRASGERDRIWLRSRCSGPNDWLDLESLEAEFLPATVRRAHALAGGQGHGGGDFLVLAEFVDAVQHRRPPAVGIDAAMDMTLPGLVSQQSIACGGAWLPVPDSRGWQTAGPRPQLQMLFPTARPDRLPALTLPPGYILRQYRDADCVPYAALMTAAGFLGWTPRRIEETRHGILPGGFFVVEHAASLALVATAQARHASTDQHPGGAELGWVAGDAGHRGKGLGAAVCAAATALMLQRGYPRIYLKTDDHRLAAIAVYLKLGYEPWFCGPGMEARWDAVRGRLAAGDGRTRAAGP